VQLHERKARAYLNIANNAMETAPMTAYLAAKAVLSSANTEIYRKTRTNMIQILGVKDTETVKKQFIERVERSSYDFGPHHKITDEEGLLELAKYLYQQAKSVIGDPSKTNVEMCKRATEMFRMLDYEQEELYETLHMLVLEEKRLDITEKGRFELHGEEQLITGLRVIETHHTRAYELLKPYVSKSEKARKAMRPLSKAFEKEGKSGDAYCAEMQYKPADKRSGADNARIQSLRQRLIEDNPERCPYEFGWYKDIEAKKLWYTEHGDKMQLGDRHEFALDLSQETGDESYVQPVREELMQQGGALHNFKFHNDSEGMIQFRRRFLERVPALAQYEELMVEILGLRTWEEERESGK
jgi:hypothetical protein